MHGGALPFTEKKCNFQSKKLWLWPFLSLFSSPELLRSSWVCRSVKPLTCGPWAVSLLSCFWAGLCIQEHLSTTRWEHGGGCEILTWNHNFLCLNPLYPASAFISAHCCCLSSFSLCDIPIVSGQGARSSVCFHSSWVYPVQKKSGQFVVNPWFPNPKAVETPSCQSRSEGCVCPGVKHPL